MDTIRRFVARLRNGFWLQPQTLSDGSAGAGQGLVRSQNLDSNTSFRPISALGPSYLDHLEGVYKLSRHLERMSTILERDKRNYRVLQARLDASTSDITALALDRRMDFSLEIETTREELQDTQRTQETLKEDIAEQETDIRRMAECLQSLWVETFKHGQEYLNRCLDVSFDELWSLSHSNCLILHELMDEESRLRHRRAELRELEYKRIEARVQAGNSSSPLVKRLANAKRIVEMTEENHRERRSRFARSLEPFLVRAGVLEDSTSPSQTTPELRTYSRGTQTQLSSSSSSPRPRTPDRSGRATQEYLRARDMHESLQAKVASLHHELRRSRTKHFLAFPRSNSSRFEFLVKKLTAKDTKAMHEAEISWLQARQRLLDLGTSLPSPGSRKRRRLNLARAMTVQDADPFASPMSPSSRLGSGLDDRSNSRSTASLSSYTGRGRKRRLEEYEEEMEKEWETVSPRS